MSNLILLRLNSIAVSRSKSRRRACLLTKSVGTYQGCDLGQFFIEFKFEFSIFIFAISSPVKINDVFSS